MHELITNLHMHTTYSDGSGVYADLARAALKTGVDVLLVTDHNTYVQGVDGYYRQGRKRMLLLVGEEIHDQDRVPQKNHMLVFNAGQELSSFADDPQVLVNAIKRAGGLSFIAHPIDLELPAFHETNISWDDWYVTGYTGLELWNGFSEFKTVAKNALGGIFYAFFPRAYPRGPHPRALEIWDDLLIKGQRIVAVGGSDAHALRFSLGPLRKVIFPYEFHFSCVNTHLITASALSGDLPSDRRLVYDALAGGHCFIGYDLPAPTRGFRFSAHGAGKHAIMGDEISRSGTVTLQAKVPGYADIRLVKDGEVVSRKKGEALAFVATEPGAYRIEAYRRYLGRMRVWIFSNPIYVR